MPRGARLDAPGTLHHVIIRGIEQGSIVRDDTDRNAFLDRMEKLVKGSGTSIYAFAMMSNHAHILLKSGQNGLSTFMRRLLSGYAQYFNRRHKRVGHLFQNRYKSIICEEEAYFNKLVAYIHLNPLRAGLVESLAQLATWPWSGHAVLMSKDGCAWMDRDYVLRFFGKTDLSAKRAYVAFLEKEMGFDREDELSGGGLIRSHGGWSKVLSMRRSGEKAMSDERILGGDEFVSEVLGEAEGRKDVMIPHHERLDQYAEAIEKACESAGVTKEHLQTGSKRGVLPRLRRELARKGVEEYAISLAETARQLGVTTNAVSYMLKQGARVSDLS
jgi:REP element-mobilizing transposase RayT